MKVRMPANLCTRLITHETKTFEEIKKVIPRGFFNSGYDDIARALVNHGLYKAFRHEPFRQEVTFQLKTPRLTEYGRD